MQTNSRVFAQVSITETPPANPSQSFITNTFEGEPAINVRTGPSTILYPAPCGALPFGASAAAIGASPGRDWVQITFADCPGGTGWVYATNVTLSGAPPRVVEPPPTPIPLVTSTFDPTLEAAFQVDPTETRLPTFTPPPTLSLPTFQTAAKPDEGFPSGLTILAFAVMGSVVLIASIVSRR